MSTYIYHTLSTLCIHSPHYVLNKSYLAPRFYPVFISSVVHSTLACPQFSRPTVVRGRKRRSLFVLTLLCPQQLSHTYQDASVAWLADCRGRPRPPLSVRAHSYVTRWREPTTKSAKWQKRRNHFPGSPLIIPNIVAFLSRPDPLRFLARSLAHSFTHSPTYSTFTSFITSFQSFSTSLSAFVPCIFNLIYRLPACLCRVHI